MIVIPNTNLKPIDCKDFMHLCQIGREIYLDESYLIGSYKDEKEAESKMRKTNTDFFEKKQVFDFR